MRATQTMGQSIDLATANTANRTQNIDIPMERLCLCLLFVCCCGTKLIRYRQQSHTFHSHFTLNVRFVRTICVNRTRIVAAVVS